jgi:protocatechuate 3,4-dioxygenase beta subunit
MKRGFVELVTQMYFPGQSLNETDRLLQRKEPAEQKLMIAEVLRDKHDSFHYRIVIERA